MTYFLVFWYPYHNHKMSTYCVQPLHCTSTLLIYILNRPTFLVLFQIYFGTSAGHLIVTEKNLARISDTEISNGVAITCMSWSCEKFKMEDGDDKPASK